MAKLVNHWDDIEVYVTKDMDELGPSATDQSIAEYVATQNGFIVTSDRDFRSQKVIADLCKQHKVGVFLLEQKIGYWDAVQMLIKRWPGMVDAMRNRRRPFWFEVKPRGLKELPLR